MNSVHYETPQGRKEYPAYNSRPADESWSMFGYYEAMINMAAAYDDEKAIQWMHDKGWIDHKTETLDCKGLVEWCEMKKAARCAAKLRSLGYAR